MRRLVVVLLVCAAPVIAMAAPDPDAEVDRTPTPTRVDARLTGATATLVAHFQIAVARDAYVRDQVRITLPDNAIVTGATAVFDRTRHPLALVRAAHATAQFDKATSAEASGSKVAAVLIEGGRGTVDISIASPRAGQLELVLELTMPTCFHRDRRFALVPTTWTRVAGPTARRPVAEDGELERACDDVRADCGCSSDLEAERAWLEFPALEVAHRRSGDRVAAFAGRAVLGETHIVRLEVDLATTLADVPRDLATVVVVDGSRSMSTTELDRQRELVMSYLRQAPHGRVQVVAFARTAHALLPTWTTASQARPRVERELRAMAPRNGSNLDAGLAAAATWLDRIGGTRRVVVITDERMAQRLANTPPVTLKRLLPAGTLVHVVAADARATGLNRDDDTGLAGLAAATDGMAVRLGTAGDEPALDATMLVRPIRFDHLKVKAPGWTAFAPSDVGPQCTENTSDDDTTIDLAAGDACTWWGQGDQRSGPIEIEGLLWGRRVVRRPLLDVDQARTVARELSIRGTTDEGLQALADRQARGVNGAWSLLVTWGGRNGYEHGLGYGMSGCGCGGSSDVGTFSHGTRLGTAVFPKRDLRTQLAPLVAACKLGDVTAHVALEMTQLEIADVRVQLTSANALSPARARALESCVAEAMWGASPMLSQPRDHVTHTVTFGP